jgi:hypothetical protein
MAKGYLVSNLWFEATWTKNDFNDYLRERNLEASGFDYGCIMKNDKLVGSWELHNRKFNVILSPEAIKNTDIMFSVF